MLSWWHLAALRELDARLRGGVRWALTGSASFALQGMPVEAHDIDVQTDATGAYTLAGRFAEAVTRPVAFSEAERIRSHFGALWLYGVTVEIMGDIAKRLPDGRWEEPVDLNAHTRFVEAHGPRLPVLALWSTRPRHTARWDAPRPRICSNAGLPHTMPLNDGDALGYATQTPRLEAARAVRGSSRSRRASPTRLRQSTVTMMASAGPTSIQGSLKM